MNTIPLVDLTKQLQPLKKEMLRVFEKSMNNTEFTYGEETLRFEKEFAKLCGTKYALGVNSGTTSLIIALKAARITLGDEVITTPMTFSATADAIIQVGATPVFVDVDPDTGNIDPKKITTAITHKTKAVLIVHLYGVPAEMESIVDICKNNNLLLLEDASHGHGSLYKNKPIGSFGLAGCFSLYPSKILGALGNAGVIVSNNKKFIELAKAHAHHGIQDNSNKYLHHLSGVNALINAIQAAFLLVKIKKLSKWIVKRRKIAQKYNAVFQKNNHAGMVWSSDSTPSLYVYAVQIANREKFQRSMKKNGIQTGVYYPIPLHLQPSMKYLGYKKGDFSFAEKFSSQTVSLPLYPELTEKEIQHISQSIQTFLSEEN